MKSPSVAIVKSDFHDNHSSAWGQVWINYCKENNIRHKLVDWRDFDFFDELAEYDIVMWHFSHYSPDEMLFAPSILSALKEKGCRVFPDHADSLHFDDKVAQAYLLQALGLDAPINYPLHSMKAVDDWINKIGKFPVVAKLRTGSGSNNVVLISNKGDLRKYASKMFYKGMRSNPSTLFKLKSNIKSTKSLNEFINRLKRVPEFLFSRKTAKSLPIERGYVYLQEFIENVNYDLKIAVVGDRLSFVARGTRAGEFRASGGGNLFYDRSLLDESMINAAFLAYDSLDSDCTGLDMIKDPISKKPVILEVSYGFSHQAQIGAGGYFDRNCVWHDEPFNPPKALLKNILREVIER
mgnify:FL=1|tara:strand:+ start:3862 stop:4917 length:1056 start_codon:yes stop_codon:yes gene_type:complete